jgi:hypothetical protein
LIVFRESYEIEKIGCDEMLFQTAPFLGSGDSCASQLSFTIRQASLDFHSSSNDQFPSPSAGIGNDRSLHWILFLESEEIEKIPNPNSGTAGCCSLKSEPRY